MSIVSPQRPAEQRQEPLRDRPYLEWLKTQRCILTGRLASESEAVDPAHIGTLGKGVKSPDDEALPILHSIHQSMHARGEMSAYRERLPDDVLRAALRALARERYKEWKEG